MIIPNVYIPNRLFYGMESSMGKHLQHLREKLDQSKSTNLFLRQNLDCPKDLFGHLFICVRQRNLCPNKEAFKAVFLTMWHMKTCTHYSFGYVRFLVKFSKQWSLTDRAIGQWSTASHPASNSLG